MASMVAESWSIINGKDDSNGVEVSQFNNALLMSLLEESHGEEYNDEQVDRVIQSLEAEINANMLEAGDDYLAMEPVSLGVSDNEDGENCLDSMEFEWAEMEVVPSSPSDNMNWYLEQCENELDLMVEYGDVSDYSQIYSVASSEENDFSSLWHETYETIAYN